MGTKIKKNYIKNIKSVSEFEADFNGATAYVIAGNTKGKTTFLRFIFDRLNGKKFSPDVLKDKDKEGVARIEMTDGTAFEYTLMPDGKEKLVYIHKGVAVKATKEIIEKYISKPFDIDSFLQMQPKEKFNYMLKQFDIDITQENEQLKQLISDRRLYKNLVAEKKALLDNTPYIEGEKIDIHKLYEKKEKILSEYQQKRAMVEQENEKIRAEHQKKIDDAFRRVLEHNAQQERLRQIHNYLTQWIEIAQQYSELVPLVSSFIEMTMNIPQPSKTYTLEDVRRKYGEPTLLQYPPYPENEIMAIEQEIQKAHEHNNKLELKGEYEARKRDYEETLQRLNMIETEISNLEETILSKLSTVTLPHPLSIDIHNKTILYNGRELSTENLSTAELYIAALLIGSMNLKELRTMYFDCSPLDKISMQTVLDFANKNDLQLLIERPDFDGGEMRFEIISD